MARSYANITTSIWRDDDFRTLTSDAQRLYFMLLTQADISSCGLLPITLRRWAGNASDTDIERVSIAFQELIDRRYTVPDLDREEVLVRTFVKWDGGYRVPKRLTAILAAAVAITSQTLMQVMVGELDKLGIVHGLTAKPIDSLSNEYREPIDTPRVVVTLVGTLPTHNPQPATRNPGPSTEKTRPAKAPDTFDAFWTTYPRKDAKRKAEQVYRAALKRASAETILTGAQRYRDDPNRTEQYTAMAPTWLAADRWADGSLPAEDARPAAPAYKRTIGREGW